MTARTTRIVFLLMVILGVLAVCTPPSRADSGWARLEQGSQTYVKWRVRLVMPDHPTEVFLRFYLARRHRAIERARDAHEEWLQELLYLQELQEQEYSPPPRHRGPVDWIAIADCESGGRWNYNGSSGYDGGLQFLPSTWTAVMRRSGYGFGAYAWQATASEQIAAAEFLIGPMHANPWRQWPYCWRFA